MILWHDNMAAGAYAGIAAKIYNFYYLCHMNPSQSGTNLRFGKEERLHHRTLVETLFSRGKSIYAFPLRCVWLHLRKDEIERLFSSHVPTGLSPLQMLVTVPKKKRRHAVDRVLMRRRIREAYRISRIELKDTMRRQDDESLLLMAFIYLSDSNAPFSEIEDKMGTLLSKLASRIQ